MVLAAYLTTAFIVGGAGALHLLRDPTQPASRIMFSMAMWMAALVAPLQIVAGDLHGLNTLEHQPAKIAAMEGHFETQRRRAAAPVRPARHAAGAHAVRGRDPEARQPDPDPRLERHGARPQGMAARPSGPNAPLLFWSFRVMVGHRPRHGSRRPVEPRAAAAAAALCDAAAAQGDASLMSPAGLRRRHRRLDHDRGRPPALHGLRPADDRRLRVVRSTPRRSAPRSRRSSSSTSLVFGAGAFYMLRLMRTPPQPIRRRPAAGEPMRAGGLMPAPILVGRPACRDATESGHEPRSPAGLGRPDRLRGARLRRARRLRPRRRHPVSLRRRARRIATR